jgi:serine/threonine-protein kinase
MASTLKEEPKLDRLPASTPGAIRRLIERCLNKDPKQRLQAIGEARVVLGRPMEEPVTAVISAPSRSRLGWVAWAVAGVATLALIVSSVGWYDATRPAPLRPLIRLSAEIAPDTALARGIAGGTGGDMLALSPDGERLALTPHGADGNVRLSTRLLNQSQATPLAGTDNAAYPFFSPTGDWIGFFADGKLKKIAVEGGAAVTLCDASSARGASWGDDGNIIAALTTSGVLSRVPSAGGTPVPVTTLNPGERTHRWPQVLPGGRAILFTASSNVGSATTTPTSRRSLSRPVSGRPSNAVDFHHAICPRHLEQVQPAQVT